VDEDQTIVVSETVKQCPILVFLNKTEKYEKQKSYEVQKLDDSMELAVNFQGCWKHDGAKYQSASNELIARFVDFDLKSLLEYDDKFIFFLSVK